nr:motile sperm domain-containing protein 1-like [Onthophagus taurus]
MDQVRQIPVFVFPTMLKFYTSSKHTHKQLITIYNPYDFTIKYKVLCTAPNKYNVTDPEGSIRPQSCIDLVVRHTMPISANCNGVDKFRISIHDNTTKQLLGKRDVESKLLVGEGDNVSEDGDNFHNLPHSERTPEDPHHQSLLSQRQKSLQSEKTNYLAIGAAIVCIAILMLPTKIEVVEENANIPHYLHPTQTFKIGTAYALGMLTLLIFRQ